MEPISVVVYQCDPRTAQSLAVGLSQKFSSVHLAPTREDLRPVIKSNRAQVLVFDMETSSTGEVERIHDEFPNLSIVCTHRLADDELWTEAMSRGAADVCMPQRDEVERSVMRTRMHRAAA